MLSVYSLIFAACLVKFAESACPAGWMSYGNNCYKFQTEKNNWVNAREQCIWHNSDLMSIEDSQEQDWFVSIAKTFNHTDEDDGFWLSGSDWEVESTWVWEATKLPMTYKNWGDTQPNNRQGAEHCLAAVKYFNYKWSDEACDWSHLIQYVCERKAADAPVVG